MFSELMQWRVLFFFKLTLKHSTESTLEFWCFAAKYVERTLVPWCIAMSLCLWVDFWQNQDSIDNPLYVGGLWKVSWIFFVGILLVKQTIKMQFTSTAENLWCVFSNIDSNFQKYLWVCFLMNAWYHPLGYDLFVGLEALVLALNDVGFFHPNTLYMYLF